MAWRRAACTACAQPAHHWRGWTPSSSITRRGVSAVPRLPTAATGPPPLSGLPLGALATGDIGSGGPLPVDVARSATAKTLSRGHEAQAAELQELGVLVAQLRDKAPQKAVDWMLETVESLQREHRDRAALLKRSWSDSPFEEGEAGNERTVEGFELELVDLLRNSSRGLRDGTVLGNAIDLAGAYKKNYKLDKAEAVLLRCTRHAELRSGPWMAKYLNHISQVRMKQSRDVEALEMMYEIESLAAFRMEEPSASEFYETLYRNMSSALRRTGREDEAARYFMKMLEAARLHKTQMDWMDLWDLGILIANRAYHAERWPEFHKSREIIAEALRRQQLVEPNEQILRAKVLSNLGQCYLATGEHDECDLYYSEAYELFSKTVGKRSPLFGMQAWACANLRCAEGRHAEALPLLGEALFVEAVSDGLSVSEMSKLLDQILGSIHELPPRGGADVEAIGQSFGHLIADPRWGRLEGTLELAVLAHKIALVHLSARMDGPDDLRRAAMYNERSVEILTRLAGVAPSPTGAAPRGGVAARGAARDAGQWLAQAEAVQRAVLSERWTRGR